MKLPFFVFCILLSLGLFAQEGSQYEKYYSSLAKSAMAQNNWVQALEHFEKIKNKFPENKTYDFEIAMVHYRNQNYSKAIELSKALLERDPSNIELHRLLANAYDLDEQHEKAKEHLLNTIESYPNDGEFFFDLGVIEYLKGNDQTALDHWEGGIKADPYFADNYYWVTKMYAESNKPIWAILYGEMFLNIDKGTERFAEISSLVLELNKNLIEQKSAKYILIQLDHLGTNSFEQAFESIYSDLRNRGKLDIQNMGIVSSDNSFSYIKAIAEVRKHFIELWSEKHGDSLNMPVFNWQQKLMEEGHLEAYVHWLLLNGEPNYFLSWQSKNRSAYNDFLMYMSSNPPRIDVLNYFMRKDYIGN